MGVVNGFFCNFYTCIRINSHNWLLYSSQCECAFPDFVEVVDVTEFSGGPSGPIFLDQLHCNGDETSLSECSYTAIHMCSHHDDVGIICHRKRRTHCVILK